MLQEQARAGGVQRSDNGGSEGAAVRAPAPAPAPSTGPANAPTTVASVPTYAPVRAPIDHALPNDDQRRLPVPTVTPSYQSSHAPSNSMRPPAEQIRPHQTVQYMDNSSKTPARTTSSALSTDSPVDLTDSPYMPDHTTLSVTDLSIPHIDSQSGPVGRLNDSAEVEFQYSQDLYEEQMQEHDQDPAVDESFFVQEREGRDKIAVMETDNRITERTVNAVDDVDIHIFSYFRIDESDLLSNGIDPFQPVKVQAFAHKAVKCSATRREFTVWLEVDDGGDTEVVAVSSPLLTRILGMDPAGYMDYVHEAGISKQERQNRAKEVWIRLYNLCGIFWARRRAVDGHSSNSIGDVNSSSPYTGEEPVVELIAFLNDDLDTEIARLDAF